MKVGPAPGDTVVDAGVVGAGLNGRAESDTGSSKVTCDNSFPDGEAGERAAQEVLSDLAGDELSQATITQGYARRG